MEVTEKPWKSWLAPWEYCCSVHIFFGQQLTPGRADLAGTAMFAYAQEGVLNRLLDISSEETAPSGTPRLQCTGGEGPHSVSTMIVRP